MRTCLAPTPMEIRKAPSDKGEASQRKPRAQASRRRRVGSHPAVPRLSMKLWYDLLFAHRRIEFPKKNAGGSAAYFRPVIRVRIDVSPIRSWQCSPQSSPCRLPRLQFQHLHFTGALNDGIAQNRCKRKGGHVLSSRFDFFRCVCEQKRGNLQTVSKKLNRYSTAAS